MKVVAQTYKSDGVRVHERIAINIDDESYIPDAATDIEDFLNQQYFELKEAEDE